MNNTGGKILGGLIWTYAERMLAQLIGLIVTIILARFVRPEEYGIISIATVFIAVLDTFAISGFGNALIQKKDYESIDYSSVFYFNIGFSILLYIIMFFAAKPISSFYSMEKLCTILRVMAIRIPIASINSVQQAYVAKTFQFKKFFYATLTGTIISAIVGIFMAYWGYGAWALVVQYLTNVVIDTLVLWFTVRWRPVFEFSYCRMKSLFSFGWKILVTNLLINVYSNVQDLVIGKKFTPQDLAYGNKGRQFPSLIASNINTSINKVLFPILSNEQDNIDNIKSITRMSIAIGTFVLSPLLLGLAAIANPFIEIILTPRWLPCVPYLRIMCVVFLLQPVQTASIQAFKAIGRSDLYLKLEIIKKLFGFFILAISVFCYSTVMAIFVASLVAEMFSTLINIPFNKKYFAYSYREQIWDVGKSFILASGMYFFVLVLETFIKTLNPYLLIVTEISFGILFYSAFSYIFNKDYYIYIKILIKQLFKK